MNTCETCGHKIQPGKEKIVKLTAGWHCFCHICHRHHVGPGKAELIASVVSIVFALWFFYSVGQWLAHDRGAVAWLIRAIGNAAEQVGLTQWLHTATLP